MASSQTLYLFKAARRPLYRKENLQLLAAERGSVVDVWYNRAWVAPELLGEGAIRPGTPVVFVFTDRPYTRFVPVRQGEVLEAGTDELGLRLRVIAGNRVGVPGNDLAAYTRAVKEADPGGVPGARFVAPKRDDVELTAYYDARADEGWRRVVENILEASKLAHDDPYRRSVFFRPLGLRVDGELHVDRRVPLAPGARAALVLGFHNPHLTEDDVARLELRVLAPEDAVRVQPPARFPPTGELDVPFEVLGGEPALTVQVGPAPAEHTAVTMRFATKAEAGARRARASSSSATGEGDDDIVAAPRAELLRLYEAVRRNARMDAADELDVLDAFERLVPDAQRLAERRALLHAERGEDERAWQVLRGLDPERMSDDARFLLFRLHAARDGGAGLVHHVLALDLTAEGRFNRFVDVLGTLPPHTLAHVVPPLAADLPAEQLRELMTRVAVRVEAPEALAETAHNLYMNTGDARWAYAFLDERYRTLRLGDVRVVDALLDLAEAGGRDDAATDLADEAARRIGNLIEVGRIDDARAQLTRARRALRPDERERLYDAVAERLAGKRQFAAAAEVLLELSREALRAGELAEASEAVERAVGLWVAGGMDGAGERAGAGAGAGAGDGVRAEPRGPAGAARSAAPVVAPGIAPGADAGADANGARALPAWLADAVAAVNAAWAQCQELVEWRRAHEGRTEELLKEKLRPRYAGKRILIAGGFRNREWEERLRDLTGADVDWAERSHDEGGDLGRFGERIRAGTYALVIYRLQKSGHEVQYRLKPACEEAGVPWVPTKTAGWRGVVESVQGKTS